MSRKNTIGPEYFRLHENDRLMRTHETVVDLINDRPANHSFLDALSFGYRFVPGLDRFAALTGYEDLSDEDYYYDDDDDNDDRYALRTNNRYCGFSRNFLERSLPKPSRHITAEEAERNAKELVDEEEKLKKKAEKKKQKKMRQKERRRLEKLEKENADKEKNKLVQVDPGPEKIKHAGKNENKMKNKNCSSLPPGPQCASAPVQSSDSSSEDNGDDGEEDSTVEPEELDMNSCFVSNAAAIAKRKLEQKPKHDKKHDQINSRKPCGSEQKDTTPSRKQIDIKEEKSEEIVNTNDLITRSMELAVIGNQYAISGNLEMAVKYFTDAIKHNPKEYKLFGNRSYCYEKMLQYEKALNDSDIALSMNPKWIKGLYRKGKALVGLKRYYEARVTYNEVLKLDGTCKDAAEEMMRVQLMQLMEMGFTKEQSSNALILHGTVEKALESLSGLSGLSPVLAPGECKFMSVKQNPQPPAIFPLRPLPQHQPRPSMPTASPVHRHPPDLFPIWVGDLVPSITEPKLYDLFRSVGHVHSVRVLQMRRCAFVNYAKKEDCEKAIEEFHGYAIDGTTLVVRYPDRIHTRLGVSRDASTESSGKNGKQPNECYFWRTNGCIKNGCTYKHIPENKGIDRNQAKSHP
ncbi:tetratricopeptide repeat protein 31 isoform X1 [Carassius gibelio]|uniref:tetratricopeptide repeat protein 31 isoform X1 n=1 Tax=Carassius gibelio TaxID=101364 RepID=UPI002278DA25|nr:tetratricopeptide repeat protein 31 isoform X1 [Carassius gibelio]